jgi:O-antigen/teichoic acid export membrane protein
VRLSARFLANLLGAGWSSLLLLVFVPVYVRAMGIEAYGLVGIYVALLSLMQLVELGLGPTINREMARAAAVGDSTRQRNAMRTFEVIYALTAVTLFLCLWSTSGLIAEHWLRPESLTTGLVDDAVQLMALLVLVQWPLALYQSALIGMQHQVSANVLKAAFATTNALGSVAVLYTVSPTVGAFLVWQAAIGAIQLVVTALVTWKLLPPSGAAPALDRMWLREITTFALGMTSITAAGVALTQLDKVVLSHVLSLRDFGIYTLAGIFGIGVGIIPNAVFLATFPRYSELVARGDDRSLLALYRFSAQAGAALVMATAAVAAGFSYEILTIWTGDREIALIAAPIMSLLVIGTALNGLWKHTYSLQLAYGWTSLASRLSWLMVILSVPLLLATTAEFGGLGAAAVWLGLNAALTAFGIPLTHRKLLRGAEATWWHDLAQPTIAAAATVIVLRSLIPSGAPIASLPSTLVGVMTLTLAAAVASAPYPRQWVRRRLHSLLRASKVTL